MSIKLQTVFDTAWENVESGKWKCASRNWFGWEVANHLLHPTDKTFGCFLGQTIINKNMVGRYNETAYDMLMEGHYIKFAMGETSTMKLLSKLGFERVDAVLELSEIHDRNSDTKMVKEQLLKFAEKYNLGIKGDMYVNQNQFAKSV